MLLLCRQTGLKWSIFALTKQSLSSKQRDMLSTQFPGYTSMVSLVFDSSSQMVLAPLKKTMGGDLCFSHGRILWKDGHLHTSKYGELSPDRYWICQPKLDLGLFSSQNQEINVGFHLPYMIKMHPHNPYIYLYRNNLLQITEHEQAEGIFSQPTLLLAGCILQLHRKNQSFSYLSWKVIL